MENGLHIQHLDWTVASIGLCRKAQDDTGQVIIPVLVLLDGLGWKPKNRDPLKAKDRGKLLWLDLHVRRIFLKTL